MPNSTEKYWEQQFKFLRAEPVVWALDADSLMRSFNIVAQVAENDLADKVRGMTANPPPPVTYVPGVGHNALMLGGLAVEVLLKGIALTDQAVSASIKRKDRAITRRLMSHNLRDIAQLAGVQLTAPETGLCERLETFLVWAGRYYIPKNHTEMMPRPLATGGIAPPNIYSSTDFQAVRNLTTKLRSLLPPIVSSSGGENP